MALDLTARDEQAAAKAKVSPIPFSSSSLFYNLIFPYMFLFSFLFVLSSHFLQGMPWTAAKGYDTFCPIGKFIPKDKVTNPGNVELWLEVSILIFLILFIYLFYTFTFTFTFVFSFVFTVSLFYLHFIQIDQWKATTKRKYQPNDLQVSRKNFDFDFFSFHFISFHFISSPLFVSFLLFSSHFYLFL